MTEAEKSAPDDWQQPYRSRDASGDPETAGAVGHAWIVEQARLAVELYAQSRLEVDLGFADPDAPAGPKALVLYLDRRPIAVATIFRDPMNYAVLVRWRAP